jgi:hypothetical protein
MAWMDQEFRKAIHKRDGWKCVKCGQKVGFDRAPGEWLPELGRIKGTSLGGQQTANNLMTLCPPCNKENTKKIKAESRGTARRLVLDADVTTAIIDRALAAGSNPNEILRTLFGLKPNDELPTVSKKMLDELENKIGARAFERDINNPPGNNDSGNNEI